MANRPANILSLPTRPITKNHPIARALAEDGTNRKELLRRLYKQYRVKRSMSWLNKVCSREIVLNPNARITRQICTLLSCDLNYLYGIRATRGNVMGRAADNRPL